MELPPSNVEPTNAPAEPANTSLPARLLNVFAVPGEVFDEVRRSPSSVGNWLVPMLLMTLIMVTTVLIMGSQPSIRQQIREHQVAALDKQVKAGKLTQEQADQFAGLMEKTFIVGGLASSAVFGAVRVLWWALILWLMGRLFLKTRFAFIKSLEVSGLAMMVGVLGSVVTLLLIVNLSRVFASPSLALTVHDFDVTRKSHLFLGAVNLFSIWLVGLMALGLSKLAAVPFMRAAYLVSLFWVLQELLFILSGMGQMAL
jgi:hypothetical protein